MRSLIIAACLAVAGCASAPPPVPISENTYYQDMRHQLGIDRAEQRQAQCAKVTAPTIGMNTTQVLASCWGNPDHAAESTSAQGKTAIWAYPEGTLFLTNGIVTRIVTSR